VLTAAQVNTYLQEQTVMVFASSAARTSALSGVLAEGMVSYLQDTNAVEVYNGSAWVGVSGAGDITEVQAGTGISVASGTGPIPVITNTVATAFDAAGDLVYGTGADTFTKLSLGTAGQVLKVNSGATAPEWGAAGGTSGLTLITSGTFTTSSAINVSDCFSATYKDYKILVKITASSTPQAIDMRMRVSGANNTDSNHDTSELKQVSTTVSGAQFVDVNRFQEIASAYTGNYVGLIDILMINPYATDYTGGYANSNTFSSGDRLQKMVSFAKEATTSFTGFGLIPSVGTISGSYKVYGLAD
jgi:hypothetical protein